MGACAPAGARVAAGTVARAAPGAGGAASGKGITCAVANAPVNNVAAANPAARIAK